MSNVGTITRHLQDTSAQIARIEREISNFPNERGLLVNLSALEKRMRTLEAQFAELTNQQLLDICDYRLIAAEPDSYPISAVGNALVAFQHMVTVFLDAIKTGPKIRARVTAEVAGMASMNFAYSYPGSLGFTMSVPNERMIAVDSDLDLAIERAFQVINSREASDIAVLAKQIGVASVRSVYGWAKQHSKYRLSAEIRWRRGNDIRNQTMVDVAQLDRLASLIEQTSETTDEQLTFPGILAGVDTVQRTFRFEPESGDEIRGRISESISFSRPFEIPSALVVVLKKQTKVYYSTEREEVDWELTAWRERE